MTRVRLLTPAFPPAAAILEDYETIVANGIFTNGGPVEQAFSRAVEDWVGKGARAASVANATSGLELAMRALFERPGRQVLVASFTFAAGPLAIIRCGFEPVFIDIDPSSWQPSLEGAETFLEHSSRAVAGILLTATFGAANARIAAWEELARHHRLPLVIDCAAGFGSRYPAGEPVGARGDCEVFSLHATKMLAVGEGGVVTATDPEIIAAINQLKNFGFDDARQSVRVGTNAKLSELAAAIGLRQLQALPERLRQRQNTFDIYTELLEPLGVEFQPGAGNSAICFVPALIPSNRGRDALMQLLAEMSVECRSYYNPPVHRHPVFSEASVHGPLSTTEDLCSRIISLPMADQLDPAVVERIAGAVQAVI